MKIKYKIDPNLLEDEANRLKVIRYFLEQHIARGLELQKKQDYYEVKHDILGKQAPTDTSKPDNRLVNNYAKYIVDVATGYFMGITPTYNAGENNKALDDDLKDIFMLNDEPDTNSELAKQCSIKGVAYELIYQGQDAQTHFKHLDATETFVIRDNSIVGNVLLGVRFYEELDPVVEKTHMRVIVYSDRYIEHYDYVERKLFEVDIEEHYFDEVPIIEYINNEEMMGDFDNVKTLIDSYNDSQSNTANDFDYFSDAYLYLVGMQGTESDDIAELKRQRVLLLSENGSAGFLTKDINDSASENFKTRLKTDIHTLSFVPDLSDEKFAGTASGVALKYKLWGLEQSTSTKQLKFQKALRKRLRLINNIWSKKGKNYNIEDVDIAFYRNLPSNLLEIVESISKLGNTISSETKLEQIPFVDDVSLELKRIKAEEKEQLQDLGLREGNDINRAGDNNADNE